MSNLIDMLPSSWKNMLKEEFSKSYFLDLISFVEKERKYKKIYPPKEKTFQAFQLTPFNEVKVVLVGQDPYHGANQANGLCFSVTNDVLIPPSLKNIFKERKEDVGIDIPNSGDISFWAKQGVLLLNTCLTVEEGKPNSHKNKGWEIFTDTCIRILSEQKDGIVFLLWGNHAQSKAELINEAKHFVLKAAHPSPFSAHKGFFGSKHFSITNKLLRQQNIKEISW